MHRYSSVAIFHLALRCSYSTHFAKCRNGLHSINLIAADVYSRPSNKGMTYNRGATWEKSHAQPIAFTRRRFDTVSDG